MRFRVALEDGMEGRSIAWALEHVGCFAYGSTPQEALENLPVAIREYAQWIAEREDSPWVNAEQIEVQVEETWQCYHINEDFERVSQGYEVNAWFLYDWKPLTEIEVERAIKILTWSRQDLLASVRGLSPEVLNADRPGERWSIDGILRHVGGAEWWYMDRLGLAFPRQELPSQSFERLERVRARLMEVLPSLVGKGQVVGVDGEFWSPRKMVRRAAWHERDHINHIRKLIGAAG
jgi:hypothetical protein